MENFDVKSILDKINQSEKKLRFRGLIFLLIGVAVIITLTFFTYKMINITGKDLKRIQKENSTLKEYSQLIKQDSLKIDEVNELVSRFLSRNASGKNGLDSTIFAQRISRYYSLVDTDRNRVMNEEKDYWERYPDAHLSPELNTLITTIKADSGFISLIRATDFRDKRTLPKEVWVEIRMNNKKEIYFVRGYYDQPDLLEPKPKF